MTRDLLWFGLFEGLYGGLFGIVAGPTGICLSKLNNLSRTQCLWKVYITFIFFTVMGSTVGIPFNITSLIWISNSSESDSYTALSYVQLILLIGKDSYFNFLIKRVLSCFECFVLGFLELRLLLQMPAQSIIRGSFRANPSRKSYRCSKEQ